jgi:hypothetical protein
VVSKNVGCWPYAPMLVYVDRCKKSVVVPNKMNSLLKIFSFLHEHYNYLQITQIGNYSQMFLKIRVLFGSAWIRIR